MIHSMEKQLQVVLRALGDVVAPALTDVDKHVVEQLHLSIATLSFVATRLPQTRRFYRQELAAYLDLATSVGEAAKGEAGQIDAIVATGRALLLDPEADLVDYEQATRRCRDAIATASGANETVDHLIMTKSEAIIAQSRVWCTPFGFELKPEELPAPAW